MIKGFRHKGLERFFYDGDKRGIQAQQAQRIADVLDRSPPIWLYVFQERSKRRRRPGSIFRRTTTSGTRHRSQKNRNR